MATRKESLELKSKRSRILYEITGLVVVLVIASGLLTFFFVNTAFDRLVDESIDRVIEEQAATIDSGLRYVGEREAEAILGDLSQLSMDEMIEMTKEAAETGEPSAFALDAAERMKELVADEVLGLDMILDISLANPPVISQDLIIVSTDDELMMKKPPDALLAAIEEAQAEGKTYVFMEEGMPEVGREGEYLVSLYDMSELNPLFVGQWGAHFVSMRKAVVSIEDFYDSEKARATWIIALIIGVSVLLVILITYFILSYLIRTRITEPIDKLSAAAGAVMDGNLDIEVKIHEGSDLEELERAFKAMVDSIRNVIARSMEH
ncbi:MAG: HAMP domain-containing protein [Actinobacteria bacterium]|nr:HAMP domain-containing protein [Actinomycetota bacterium]